MQIGTRIIYNSITGKVLYGPYYNVFGEVNDSGLTQEMADELRPAQMSFIDVPYDYNDNNFKEAIEYSIDVTMDATALLSERIVITQYMEHQPTYEELQQQLLIAQGVI